MAIPSVQGTPTTGSGNGDDATPTLPAGVTDGETVVYCLRIHGSTDWTTDPADDGWTEDLNQTDSTRARQGIYTIVASSLTAPTVTLASSTRYAWVCFRTDANGTNGTPAEQSGNDTTPTCPSITTSVNNCLILRVIGAHDIGSTDLADYTPPGTQIAEVLSTIGSSDTYLGVGSENQASAGATGTAAGSYTNTEAWQGMTVALKESLGAASTPGVQIFITK